jgi:hypothetical protein
MNESVNKSMLYETNDAVRALNKVEGFEPKNYLRKEENEEGVSFYLDTKYRLLWFGLKYENGKIVKIPKVLNREYATFEVRIYADRNDAEDNFLANGFASRYKDDGNEKFGLNFVESAETAALGRALKDAGFGTQFCDIALPNDQTIVDAGVHISFDLTNDEVASPIEEMGTDPTSNGTASPVSSNDESVIPTSTVKSASKVEQKEVKIELSKDMTVEELLGKMTVDYAKAIVVDYGIDKGKTLGRLAAERPQGVQYHASQAKNNLIRAGAIYLLEQAKSA